MFYPHILGVGYGATDEALKQLYPLSLLLILVVAKIGATAITVGGGFGGGVFSPSIYIGAMLGGAFGLIAAIPFPDLAASTGVYAIVGMGAVASAVLGAPISTILIVFDLTADYQVVIAVMVSSTVATIVTRALVGKSFFHWQLERRGLILTHGRLHHVLQQLQIRDLLTGSCPTVPEDEPVSRVRSLLDGLSEDQVLVVTDQNRYVGMIGFKELATANANAGDELKAKDITNLKPVVLEADTPLERALNIVKFSSEERLPVVESLQSLKVLGLVRHVDILIAYNKALLEDRSVGHK